MSLAERWDADTGPHLLFKNREEALRYRAENPPSKIASIGQYQGWIEKIADQERRHLAKSALDRKDWDALNDLVLRAEDG